MQDRGSAFTTTPLPHLPSSSHQRSRTFRHSFLMFHISFRWINSIMFLMVWLRVKFLFWKFFFSSYFRMTTKDFWNWKIQKIMTPKGFSSKLFFQNSCFFSNISYRRCHRGPFIGRKECIYELLCIKVWVIHQNDEFWKFCLLEKCFRIPIFLIFWARKSPLDMGSWLVLKKISSNNIKYVKLCEELMYRGICWNNHFFVGFSTCQTLQTQRSRSFDPFDLLFFFPCR